MLTCDNKHSIANQRPTWASVSRGFIVTQLSRYWHDRLIVHVNELNSQVKWHCVTQSPPLRHWVGLLVWLALTLNKDILSYSNRFFTQKLRTKGNLLFGQNQILYYTRTPILEADHFLVLCRCFSIYWPKWCRDCAFVLLLYRAGEEIGEMRKSSSAINAKKWREKIE